MNTNPASSFKSLAQLRVGGLDSFSKKRFEELIVETGNKAVELVKKEFPGSTKDQASALRWMLRGLASDLAIQKVRVDIEIVNRKKK